MKIYVASSWRNEYQPSVVAVLRDAGHEVYDFRNPTAGDNGFHWEQIDPEWHKWTPAKFREALNHHVAVGGFGFDINALFWCDACVLVLPCGRSAHLELGWATGARKKTVILLEYKSEPELMYKMVDKIALSLEEVVEYLK